MVGVLSVLDIKGAHDQARGKQYEMLCSFGRDYKQAIAKISFPANNTAVAKIRNVHSQ